jgi:formaldehyde-activating enzyme involved in methanogenesis
VAKRLPVVLVVAFGDLGYYPPEVAAALAEIEEGVFPRDEVKSITLQLAVVFVALGAFDDQAVESHRKTGMTTT